MTQRLAMPIGYALLTTGLLLGCSTGDSESGPTTGAQAGTSSGDPREVVVDFYANAARLDCAAALEALSFFGENADRLRGQFSSTCRDSAGNPWAEQVAVGKPRSITNKREMAALKERLPDATELLYIPVTEGGASEPSDTLMAKINGEWLITVS